MFDKFNLKKTESETNSEGKTLLDKAKNYLHWQLLLAIVIGAIGGYAYYYFVGCKNGTCSITSDPVKTVLYGMLIGLVFGFKDKTKKKAKKKNIENE